MHLLEVRGGVVDSGALDLILELVGALEAAHVELVQIGDTPIPLSDSLLKQLEERDALAATLASLPDHTRDALKPIYRDEMVKANRYDDARMPVLPEVTARLEEAFETLRRACLLDRELADAIHANGPVSWLGTVA